MPTLEPVTEVVVLPKPVRSTPSEREALALWNALNREFRTAVQTCRLFSRDAENMLLRFHALTGCSFMNGC